MTADGSKVTPTAVRVMHETGVLTALQPQVSRRVAERRSVSPHGGPFLLGAVGVTAVYGGEYCTFSDSEQFYSYRRDGQTGRIGSGVVTRRMRLASSSTCLFNRVISCTDRKSVV